MRDGFFEAGIWQPALNLLCLGCDWCEAECQSENTFHAVSSFELSSSVKSQSLTIAEAQAFGAS